MSDDVLRKLRDATASDDLPEELLHFTRTAAGRKQLIQACGPDNLLHLLEKRISQWAHSEIWRLIRALITNRENQDYFVSSSYWIVVLQVLNEHSEIVVCDASDTLNNEKVYVELILQCIANSLVNNPSTRNTIWSAWMQQSLSISQLMKSFHMLPESYAILLGVVYQCTLEDDIAQQGNRDEISSFVSALSIMEPLSADFELFRSAVLSRWSRCSSDCVSAWLNHTVDDRDKIVIVVSHAIVSITSIESTEWDVFLHNFIALTQYVVSLVPLPASYDSTNDPADALAALPTSNWLQFDVLHSYLVALDHLFEVLTNNNAWSDELQRMLIDMELDITLMASLRASSGLKGTELFKPGDRKAANTENDWTEFERRVPYEFQTIAIRVLATTASFKPERLKRRGMLALTFLSHMHVSEFQPLIREHAVVGMRAVTQFEDARQAITSLERSQIVDRQQWADIGVDLNEHESSISIGSINGKDSK